MLLDLNYKVALSVERDFKASAFARLRGQKLPVPLRCEHQAHLSEYFFLLGLELVESLGKSGVGGSLLADRSSALDSDLLPKVFDLLLHTLDLLLHVKVLLRHLVQAPLLLIQLGEFGVNLCDKTALLSFKKRLFFALGNLCVLLAVLGVGQFLLVDLE